MNRREIITTAGIVLVAGCLSSATGEQSSPTETKTKTNNSFPDSSPTTRSKEMSSTVDSPSPTDPQTPPSRELTEINVTDVETSQFSVAAEIERSAITPEQTARFAFTITNHTEESLFYFDNCIPFTCVTESDPKGLLLLPYDGWYGQSNRVPIERETQQTWVPAPDQTIIAPDVMKVESLDKGESLTRRWELWGDPDHVSYIEPATYQIKEVTSTTKNFEWYCTMKIERT